MALMCVTREVFQSSGWLKAYACCRGSQAGHTVRGGLRTGRREAAGERSVSVPRGEGCDCKVWGAAHPKHALHVRDAGCVPARQRLVEGLRVLSRVACRVHGAGRGGLRARRHKGGGAAGERGVHAASTGGEGATADGGPDAGRQRTANMAPMSVTREVFQLSGWLKADARCRRGSQAGHTVRGGLPAGRREAAGVWAIAECARSVQGRWRDCADWRAGRGEQRLWLT